MPGKKHSKEANPDQFNVGRDLLNLFIESKYPVAEIVKGFLHIILGFSLLGVSIEMGKTVEMCSIGGYAALGWLAIAAAHVTVGFKRL